MPQYTGKETIGDQGSFSRYFDLDAWFEKKLKQLPKEVQKVFPFLIVPKASKAEKNAGAEQLEFIVKGKTRRGNIHPTVKAIQLGCYLITLGSRGGDTIIDPFCGSGSFLIAAKMMGRNYVGIDINENFCRIAEARLKIVPYQARIEEFF